MIDEPNVTLWCGNLSEQVTEELLYELFLQAGPLEKVSIAKDRDGRQKSFAFITFCHAVSVPYALNLFRGTALFNKTLNLQSRGPMVLLPPPIRCYGLEPPLNLPQAVPQQFVQMTERLQNEDLKIVHSARQPHDTSDQLVLASLQGNWSHRHHPYRGKDRLDRDGRGHRDNYRSRENEHKSGRSGQQHWRDRRNHRRGGGGHHKRD